MCKEFENRVCIVTGAAVGIGRATAKELAKGGAQVCVIDMDAERLGNVVKEIESFGGFAKPYVLDVSDEKAIRETVDDILKNFKKIDILVNNAGLWRKYEPFVESNSETWDRFFSVNVFGLMCLTHAVLPNMIENRYGRVINIGSVAGKYGIYNMTTYAATKGAVSSFTKSLAKEVAEYGITVTNVTPGNVKNEGKGDNEALSYMNRSGELEEFAYLIAFLASEKAGYISGQDFQIDGCRKKI